MWIIDKFRNRNSTKYVLRGKSYLSLSSFNSLHMPYSCPVIYNLSATFKVALDKKDDKNKIATKVVYIEGDYEGYASMDINEVFEEIWERDGRRIREKQEKYMKLVPRNVSGLCFKCVLYTVINR